MGCVFFMSKIIGCVSIVSSLQVDFLHETLRATKAQLAESEFSKAKLELENR